MSDSPAPPAPVTVFAPATSANLGPGYDVLGLAVEGLGDTVTARADLIAGAPPVRLTAITGDTALEPSDDNTACVAAREVLARAAASACEDRPSWNIELTLQKGLPIGSGLGSSGASAVAAAVAVNRLLGEPLDDHQLLEACAEGERAACGAAHRDNVAPALLGGIVLVHPDGSARRIRTGLDLGLALVTPATPVPTRLAREAIPAAIPIDEAVANCASLAQLVYALATDDVDLLSEAIVDRVAEPRRAHLIEGFAAVKQAALDAGALGASISGAGPTIFGLCRDRTAAVGVTAAMSAALQARGIAHSSLATAVDARGARRIDG